MDSWLHEARSFKEIESRLLRLTSRDLTDAEGDRQIKRLGVQAAKAYRRCCDLGVSGLEPGLCNPVVDPMPSAKDDELWWLGWRQVLIALAAVRPDRVPGGPMGVSDGIVTFDPENPQVGHAVFPASRWRSRAEDHAAACSAIADHIERVARGQDDSGFTGDDGGRSSESETSDNIGSGTKARSPEGWSQTQLIEAAETCAQTISASTFRRIREAANVKGPPSGGGYKFRFSRADVERLIKAVKKGRFRKKSAIAQGWQQLLDS